MQSQNENMNPTDQFEALVSEHYEPLYRFALSLTRAESDARDLTQQTFYIWATKGHQLRDLSKVKAWLYTTLHRAFLVGRRRQSRFPHENLEECSYKDIAAILEVHIGTVKSRIARGIGQLRKILLLNGSAPEPDYTEWDLSSTLLREQFGVM